MNVIDSSAWLAYFAGTTNAGYFAAAIEDTDALVVPALTLYEVYRAVTRQVGESAALRVTAAMQQGQVVPVDAGLALSAARLSFEHGLPLADSIILATARAAGATLWTQDADFAGVDGVAYRGVVGG